MHRSCLTGWGKSSIHLRRVLHRLSKSFFGRELHLLEISAIQNQANTRSSRAYRNHPAPGIASTNDQNITELITRGHDGVVKVTIDRDLLMLFVVASLAARVRGHVTQSTRINDELALYRFFRAVSAAILHTRPITQHFMGKHG